MEEGTINITQTIIDTINAIFSNIFASIDNNLYSILDDITFINTDILETNYFQEIIGTSTTNGILIIANSLIIGFLLYYCVRLILSNLTIVQEQRPTQFILKLIIIIICMNSSYFICEKIIYLNSSISLAIRSVGEEIFNTPMCFSSLVTKLNSIIYIEENSLNIFTIDGLLKSVISISFFNLAFSYAIRYIMVKIFILLSPFAILTLSMNQTSHIFKSWFKCFISLLVVQILVSLTLLMIFSIEFNSNNLFSKFLICGSIFTLIKANTYVKEFIRRNKYRVCWEH